MRQLGSSITSFQFLSRCSQLCELSAVEPNDQRQSHRTGPIHVVVKPVCSHRTLVCAKVVARRDQRPCLVDANNDDCSNPTGRIRHTAFREEPDVTFEVSARIENLCSAL